MTDLMPGPVAQSRRDCKRAEIVAAARELFFREGYAGASMSQLAATVGGSKTTLYSHFQSKEELLRAVVHEVVESGSDDPDLSARPADFRVWLDPFGRAAVKRITSYDNISLQRLAAAEALRFPEIGRALHDAAAARMRLGARIFADAMERGALRRTDPLAAVEQFLELCCGSMLRRVIWNIQAPPTDVEIAASVADAVAAFMDGYNTPPGDG